MKKTGKAAEKVLNGSAFVLIVLLIAVPIIETLLRFVFRYSLKESTLFVAHITFVLTFIGGIITTRNKKHLSSATIMLFLKEPWKGIAEKINYHIAFVISITIGWCGLSYIFLGFDVSEKVMGIPKLFFTGIIPVGYFFIGVSFLEYRSRKDILLAAVAFLAGSIIAVSPINNIIQIVVPDFSLLEPVIELWTNFVNVTYIPIILLLIVLGLLGVPIFIVLGAVALFLFINFNGSLEVIPDEIYNLLTDHSIPAIPLFCLTGFILSSSSSEKRLIKLFESVFGWIPGGIVIVTVFLSAFFTTFTGASGITILALGGILFVMLTSNGKYSEGFSTGLLTSSGSIGLLFPPSLPMILYGTIAGVSVRQMFAGGLLPGFLMVVGMSAIGIIITFRKRVKLVKFDIKEIGVNFKNSIWELLLPVMIIVFYFSGLMTLVETSAFAVLYIIIVELFIYRTINFRDFIKTCVDGVVIIGGVLIILGTARTLSYYFVDAQIPMKLVAWAKDNIQSPMFFLMLLNVMLLIAGCLMDIYSAIMVLVPLIVPLGNYFGINPVHLGIIFVCNLEIGFLTPPIGLNLFLASYCFDKPVAKIYKNVLPFFILQIAILLAITYIPWLSTALVELVDRLL